jgi:crotonobetainyl-CoA:carnitine CoA-transferase CaiB-like acyl-CoA transferase
VLSDVTILEIGSRTGTAYCGKLLHDIGATVIKLEPSTGDPLRSTDPSYAAFLHAGKQSVSADAGPARDGRLAALASQVQIVICDDDDPLTVAQVRVLRAHNPSVVVVTISDYGQDGPYAGTPASEFTLQAEGGLTVLHPVGDRPPVATGVELADLASAAAAALGAVTALMSVEAGAGSAEGIEVDVSRFESVIAMLQNPWLFDQIADHHAYPTPQVPVPGLELAKDGWVCAVAVTPPQWVTFKKMAGIPELDDPRFDALDDRVVNRAEVTELVRRFTSQHGVAELVELGAQFRVPVTPVGTPETLAELPPYAGRGSYLLNPTGGFTQPRSPFRYGDGVWTPGSLAAVGEHNDAVPANTAARAPVPSGRGDRTKPLTGLRVLELGTFQAGPLVTMNLAQLGADVIKVEAVNRPDLIRFAGPLPGSDQFWDRGGPYIGSNHGKRSITADLSHPDGLEIIQRLIVRSDVVLENYVPRVLDERNLDYYGVSAIRPDAVMVRLPAWGLAGPWRDRPGFTYSVDATSGLSNLTGYPDDDPLITGTVVDPIAAMFTALITLAAIRRQRRTGVGGQIEVALCDIATQLTARSVVAAAGGEVAARTGNRHPRLAPQGMYRSADGDWIAVSITTDAQWAAFAGQPETAGWAADARFAAVDGRLAHHDELDERLSAFCLGAPAASIVSTLHRIGVPAAVMVIGTEFVDHPQLLARGRIYETTHAVIGSVKSVGSAARFSHRPNASVPWATPVFGQNNHEVLTELGYTEHEIQAFVDAKLLGDSPFGLPIGD